MTTAVEKIVGEIKSLPKVELEEFFDWLIDCELLQSDEWDKEIEQDSKPGGRLQDVIDRVRKDIAAGRTKPLDEIIHNS